VRSCGVRQALIRAFACFVTLFLVFDMTLIPGWKLGFRRQVGGEGKRQDYGYCLVRSG